MKKYGIISLSDNIRVLAEVANVNIIGDAAAPGCILGNAIRTITCNDSSLDIIFNSNFSYFIDKVLEFESDNDAKLWFEVECGI